MQQACEECGAYPVGHVSAYIDNSIELLLAPLSLIFFSDIARVVLWLLLKLGVGLRLVSYRENPERMLTDRSRVIWEEARRRQLNIRQITIGGAPTEFFEVETDGRRSVFQSLPLPLASSHRSNADDKHSFKTMLAAAGIPTPRSCSVTTLRQARRALAELGIVCVKPRLGSNGRHTFPHVSTEKELAYAFASAKKLCRHVVVEEHIEGNLARATCVDGALVGFLECYLPVVVGDGRATVRELIERDNETRSPAWRIETSSVHERYIARRGYALESVLEEGARLPLVYWADTNKEYGAAINPELRLEIERAARLTQLPVVGFDLILEDPRKSPREQHWGIIEANSMPYIDLHHHGDNPQNIAGKVWDLWAEKYGRGLVLIASQKNKIAPENLEQFYLVRRVGFEPT